LLVLLCSWSCKHEQPDQNRKYGHITDVVEKAKREGRRFDCDFHALHGSK
jgi:hypothetical protein